MATRGAKDAAKRKRGRRPRRRKKTSARLTNRQLAKAAEKALETVTSDDLEKPKIRPVHWRFLRAKIDCLDAGKPLTGVNHAKHAGVSRIALWKLQQKYPWLEAWCDEVMRVANASRWGSIERRMAHLAEQGHVAAADQYCKMQGGHYTRSAGFGDQSAPGDGRIVVQNNFLIPRPDYSQPAIPAQAAPVVSTIPTVRIR